MKFKVGEIVIQVKNVKTTENPICKIVGIEEIGWGEYRIRHIHRGSKVVKKCNATSFRKISGKIEDSVPKETVAETYERLLHE